MQVKFVLNVKFLIGVMKINVLLERILKFVVIYMYRINGKITIILWAIALIVAVYMLFFSFDFYTIIGTGFTLGIATAQTIDNIREKKFMSKYKNYENQRFSECKKSYEDFFHVRDDYEKR